MPNANVDDVKLKVHFGQEIQCHFMQCVNMNLR